MALIVDTGPMFAAMDRADPDHRSCRELLEASVEPLVTTVPVLVELEWLSGSRLGPAAFDSVLGSIEDGALRIAELDADDWRRIRALCATYADLPLGIVDASVIALAERLGGRVVATLDRRHFSVVRPKHVPALGIIPG